MLGRRLVKHWVLPGAMPAPNSQEGAEAPLPQLPLPAAVAGSKIMQIIKIIIIRKILDIVFHWMDQAVAVLVTSQ